MKNHHALTSGFVLLCLTTTGAASQPFPASKPTASPNIAYTYTTDTTGGTGDESFKVPLPPNGFYYASFAASFTPIGSTASPEIFSCTIFHDDFGVAQSTAYSGYTSGWNIGVSAGTLIQVKSKTHLRVDCGTVDTASWTWANIPLKVTLVKVDATVAGNLTAVVGAGVTSPGNGALQSLGRTR